MYISQNFPGGGLRREEEIKIEFINTFINVT